jgi:hypothetical protein
MNGRIVWRVMWKEYRALRGLWIAVALASWMAQLGVFMLSRELSWWEVAWGAALVTPVFYALGAAAATFAGEREEGADRFLLALPVSTAPLVTGKMLFLLLSTVAIVPAVALTTAAAPWWPESQLHDERLLVIWAPAVLEVAAWGLLFSLLGRSVMQAATLGAVASAIAVSIVLSVTNPVVDTADSQQYWNALPLRLALVGLVLGVDLLIARNWLLGALVGERNRALAGVDQVRAAWQRAVSYVVRPFRWQGRLVWLAARQTAWGTLLVAAGAVVCCLLIQLREPAYPEWLGAHRLMVYPSWELALSLVGVLIGSMVFAGDQRLRGYRCLAEHGSSARAVWFSRQAIGLTVLFVAVSALHLAWLAFHERPMSEYTSIQPDGLAIGRSVMTARQAALVMLGYGAGQLISICFTNSLVATLVAIMAAVPCIVGYRLSTLLNLPAAYTLWPLVAGLFAASAVFVSRWLLDQRGPMTWLRTVGTFGLFAGGVLAIVPELRLSDVPDEELNFDVAEFQASLGPEAQRTANLYRTALMELTPYRDATFTEGMNEFDTLEWHAKARRQLWRRLASGELVEADREWLAANQRSIDLTLRANARPTCAFVGEIAEYPVARMRADLVLLLMLRGAAAENRAVASREAVEEAFGLIRHIRPDQRAATELERSVLEFVLAWSVWPGQTPAELAAMRQAIAAYGASLPDPAEFVKYHYLESEQRLAENEMAYSDLFELWESRAPWERIRAERLLKVWANENLETIEAARFGLAQNADLRWLNDSYLLYPDDTRFETTLRVRWEKRWQRVGYFLSQTEVARAANRRATEVILELVSARLRAGVLPATLEELAGEDPFALPNDPYTGEAFVYLPHGFPVEVQLNAPLGPQNRQRLTDPTPLLWTPGLDLKVVRENDTGDYDLRFLFTNREGPSEATANNVVAWERGLTFRIPAAAKYHRPATYSPLPPESPREYARKASSNSAGGRLLRDSRKPRSVSPVALEPTLAPVGRRPRLRNSASISRRLRGVASGARDERLSSSHLRTNLAMSSFDQPSLRSSSASVWPLLMSLRKRSSTRSVALSAYSRLASSPPGSSPASRGPSGRGPGGRLLGSPAAPFGWPWRP